MNSFVMAMTFGVACLLAWNDDLRAASHQTSEAVEAVRRLAAEFESAQRSAFDIARKAKTEAEEKAAMRAMPDRRKYAQRFLVLVSETTDEAATVDALVWVVRNGIRTPEGDEAVRKIAGQYIRSDRIAAVCHALGARGPEGEGLLKQIFEENPNPEIRGRACLALAFARSLQLRKEVRTQASLPQNLPDGVAARELVVQKRKSKTIALAAEIEHWLRLVLDEFPGVLLDQDITEDFEFGAENLGPTAGQIMRRIAETHPQSATRLEAECGLALQQMEIASLVADLRSMAALPPESKHCAGPGLVAACVFGGESRLNAVDSRALVREIEQRLQRIADGVKDVNNPGIIYFHLIWDSPTLSRYHAGTEAILRRVAEGHPSRRLRAAARHSLAIYLAGIADLSRTIDSERAHWVDRLGEDRVEQIRRFNPDRLMHESSALAEEISKENQEAGRIPDAKIEGLRKASAHRGVTTPEAAPPPSSTESSTAQRGGPPSSGRPGAVVETGFFSIIDRAGSFAYVIDRSGSMAARDAMDVVKREVRESVKKLTSDVSYCVVFYNLRATVFADSQGRPGLMGATEVNKERTRIQLEAIKADGGTDHRLGLRTGLAERPQVVFFLTDADLMTNEDATQMIAEAGKTRIHVIELKRGAGEGSPALRRLAVDTGGRYRVIDINKLPKQ